MVGGQTCRGAVSSFGPWTFLLQGARENNVRWSSHTLAPARLPGGASAIYDVIVQLQKKFKWTCKCSM